MLILKSILIVIVHGIVDCIVIVRMFTMLLWGFDYKIRDLIVQFIIGIAIIGFDYLLCRFVLEKNNSIVKKKTWINWIDFIILVPTTLIKYYSLLVKITVEKFVSEYDILFYVLSFLLGTAIIIERITIGRFLKSSEREHAI